MKVHPAPNARKPNMRNSMRRMQANINSRLRKNQMSRLNNNTYRLIASQLPIKNAVKLNMTTRRNTNTNRARSVAKSLLEFSNDTSLNGVAERGKFIMMNHSIHPFWRNLLKAAGVTFGNMNNPEKRRQIVNTILSELSAGQLAQMGPFTQSNLKSVRAQNGILTSVIL